MILTRDEAIRRLTAPGQSYELVETHALGRRIRAFRNAPRNLGQLYAEGRSGETFVVYEDERLSFEEGWLRAARLAHALAADHGVGKGDRVAISMRNYPEWIIAFQAVTSLGAIAVAMNALWQSHEMIFALQDSQPKVLFVDAERLERLARGDGPPEIQVIVARSATPPPPGVRTFDAVLSRAEANAPPAADIEPDDDAIMLFTSGSTGRPKGAVSTHRNIMSALMSWELDAEAAVLVSGAAAAPASSQPASLLSIPLFHVSGLHVSLLQSYRAQRRLVCMYKWDADLAAEIIERERITGFNAPPAVTGDLVEVAKRAGRDLSSLVAVGGGGAPRAPEQVRAIDAAFENAAPNTGWGMTETNAIGASVSGADYLGRPSSSGRVSAVLDIRIVDEAGAVLSVLERGELQIRGASIMRGYWNRPDANAEAFTDGWFRTGDVAYVDAEGFIFIVDRLKDLVIRGGENIGCGAVEAALLEHPDIVEASVYGAPDERLGEEVAATVYARRAVRDDELTRFLQSRLARFEIPRYFDIRSEPLPRIASGKIFKRQLRDELVGRLDAMRTVGAG